MVRVFVSVAIAGDDIKKAAIADVNSRNKRFFNLIVTPYNSAMNRCFPSKESHKDKIIPAFLRQVKGLKVESA